MQLAYDLAEAARTKQNQGAPRFPRITCVISFILERDGYLVEYSCFGECPRAWRIRLLAENAMRTLVKSTLYHTALMGKI